MRSLRVTVAWLFFSAAATFATTGIEREFVRLTLPDGWTAGPPPQPAHFSVGDEPHRSPALRGSETLTLSKGRVGCLIRLSEMPVGEFRLFAERSLRAELGHAGVENEGRFKRWAEREGIGAVHSRRHPYDIVTSTRLFFFHHDGFACMVRAQSSDRDPMVAKHNLNAALPEVEAILRSFEIRRP